MKGTSKRNKKTAVKAGRDASVGGDVVGGDKVTTNITQNFYQHRWVVLVLFAFAILSGAVIIAALNPAVPPPPGPQTQTPVMPTSSAVTTQPPVVLPTDVGDELFGQKPSLAGVVTFASDRNGNLDIFSLDVGGGQFEAEGGTLGDDHWPAWTRDGSRLAFASHQIDRDSLQVRTRGSLQGDTVSRLILASLFTHPTWSLDGDRLVFSVRFPERGVFDLYYIASDGKHLVGIKRPDDTHDLLGAAWSPDGEKIAFFAIDSSWTQSSIYRYDFAGNQLAQLSPGTALDVDPAWSPDGKRIAFSRNGDIWIMAADGTEPQPLIVETGEQSAPAWSSDAAWLSYQSNQDGNWEIYVADTSTGSSRWNITMNAAQDREPTWRP